MDEKLESILQGAGALFKKYGIRSISMDDIARELGISKKTLYQVVDNKTDLVAYYLKSLVTKSDYSCLIGKTDEMNAIDILLMVSQAVGREIKEMNPVLAFDLQKYYPGIYREFVLSKRDHVYEQISRNFKQGIAEGLYRDDLGVELVSKLYVQKLIELHNPDFLSSVDFSFEKIFQTMFENHIRGIANATGLAYYENQINKLNITQNP
ncbi:MAG: TetR/AcrR family transcriptional regulator [Bacteroidales bacterium]|nr:TetR/AcrR family transcriptional regulator [Bacteroidales bacterium]